MGRPLWIILAVIGGGLILLVANHDSGSVFGLGNDRFASLLYLGIWGAVLGAAIVGSGMRLGAVARNLAVWLFLILCLMAGYQYRYELQDIASRVTAGLIPGSPLSVSGADGRAAVMLEKLSDGHFSVRARVDNAVVRFLVDTGATGTILSQADAHAAGIDPSALDYRVAIMTANGAARAARTSVTLLSIGEIERRDWPVMVAEGDGLNQSLLGMDFLGSLSAFEVRGNRMTLID